MIKYTVKLLLWEADPNPQGLFPVYIRVTISRIRRYISTGIFLPKKQWDAPGEMVKAGHPLAAQYNPDLTSRKQKVIQYITEHQVKGLPLSAQQVKDHFTGAVDLHNIFDFVQAYIAECRGKKDDSTLENYEKHARRLELFHGSRQLAFEDITPDFLGRYERHLRSPEGDDAKPVGGNYAHAIWTTLRTWFNAARKREIITCYPFNQYENPIYEGKIKEYLTVEELALLEEYADAVRDPVKKQTAIYFLLGCYMGLRISDWFLFDIKKRVYGDRVNIRAKKNGEWLAMPVSRPLALNFERMRACPLTIPEPVLNRKIKVIAKELSIDKYLTTHCGRHTFAITICAERGISAETCAELMGITVQTCVDNYYRVTNRKIDRETLQAWEGL